MIGENGGVFGRCICFGMDGENATLPTRWGASKGAVSQWLAAARAGGRKALYSQPHGTHAKLTEDQKRLIPDFLWHGPEAYGFRGEVWTCPRLVEVLARAFCVWYPPG